MRQAPASSTSGHRSARRRALPYRKPYYVALFAWFIHLLCLIAAITGLYFALLMQDMQISIGFAVAVAASLLTWFIAYFKRRVVRCPLCKGTPYLSTGAAPHIRAIRFKPLNPPVSAMLQSLLTQKFRCMDCGVDYDLTKKHRRPGEPREAEKKTGRRKH